MKEKKIKIEIRQRGKRERVREIKEIRTDDLKECEGQSDHSTTNKRTLLRKIQNLTRQMVRIVKYSHLCILTLGEVFEYVRVTYQLQP